MDECKPLLVGFVVISSLVDMAGSAVNLSFLRSLRVLRVLRTVRVLKVAPEAMKVMNSMITALGSMVGRCKLKARMEPVLKAHGTRVESA